MPTAAPGRAGTTPITSYIDDAEVTTEAVYEALDPVTIDGATFDLWFLDQGQDDLISASEYKRRIVFADAPSGGPPGQDRWPYSATVTFAWDTEAGTIDEADPEVRQRDSAATIAPTGDWLNASKNARTAAREPVISTSPRRRASDRATRPR